jgi:hypothetical protein
MINHHRNHKNERLTLRGHLYLRDIYTDESDVMALQKSTQCGISEWLIVTTFTECEAGRSVFYVLPTYDLKNRFVQNRFDTSVQYTSYYQQLIKNAGSQKSAESVSLKRIATGAVTFAGSNTPNPFTEFPADTYIVDEKDRCDMGNVVMGEERLSHAIHKKKIYVSNPTIPEFGISEDYDASDLKKWHIRCSNCDKWIVPDFLKHVVAQVDETRWRVLDKDWDSSNFITRLKDPMPICPHCNKPFDRFADGEWIPERKSFISGYHINKMFSSNNTLTEVLERFNKGLSNDTVMTRVYNGDLGLPFVAKGAKIDIEMLNQCIAQYQMSSGYTGGPCVMGIDVGTNLNITVGELLSNGMLKLVHASEEPQEYEDVVALFRKFDIKCFVIDAHPEMRFSKKLVTNFVGFMCTVNASSKELSVDANGKSISVMRTPALDAVKEAILLRNLILPSDIKNVAGFYDEMTCSVRIYNEEKDRYEWIHGNKPDHYFFSCAYLLLAKRMYLAMAGLQ